VDSIQSWDLILTFLVLAEEARHSGAAARLGISRQTLRRRIERLEAELGVALFERSHRRVELTPAGAALLEDAKPVAEEMRAVIERVRRRNPDRPLSVGMTTDIDPELVRRVEAWVHQRQAPAVLGHRPAEVSMRLLREGKLDLLLFAGASDEPADSLTVAHEQAMAVFPVTHLVATHPAVRAGDLKDLLVAVGDAGSIRQRRRTVEQLHGDPDLPYIVAPRIGTTGPGLLHAARTNGAASLVLAGAIRGHDTSGLAVLPMDPPLMIPINLARRPGLPDRPFHDLADHLMAMDEEHLDSD